MSADDFKFYSVQVRLVLIYRIILRLRKHGRRKLTFSDEMLCEVITLLKECAYDQYFHYTTGLKYLPKQTPEAEIKIANDGYHRSLEVSDKIDEIISKLRFSSELDHLISLSLASTKDSLHFMQSINFSTAGNGGKALETAKLAMSSRSTCKEVYDFICNINNKALGLNYKELNKIAGKTKREFGNLNKYSKEVSGQSKFITEDFFALYSEFFFQEEYEQVVKLLQRNPKIIKQINPRNFEEIVAEIYINKGYQVELTPRTNDGGYDLVAIEKNDGSSKFLIECKRYNKNVGVQIVRELGGVVDINKPCKGIVITSAEGFTKAANSYMNSSDNIDGVSYAELSIEVKNWLNDYDKNLAI